ncbi:hypothetical protein KV112_09940 [Mycolicibacter sp. MYC123]|uniref:Uncharacterized protein n=1 Tax=[Mycobacterium] zoologicum TaxID=2872311 RepID=A0ABU5YJR2_9MYCO|nr:MULTISPECIES: hypothetical protein [unclassified Mycolicibacter]MEB3050050.1 hypothetical protein [Mycolicibacter sp. MYC123]MEB3062414.1 hypothetical protein [Mycolicibacter sp. MYC101]
MASKYMRCGGRSRFVLFEVGQRVPAENRQVVRPSQLFYSYYKTGDIPDGYVLRPEQGFNRDDTSIDLRELT